MKISGGELGEVRDIKDREMRGGKVWEIAEMM